MEALFSIEVTEENLKSTNKEFKKLALPTPVEKGVVGTFIKYEFDEEKDAAHFYFDVDGVDLRKDIYNPYSKYIKDKLPESKVMGDKKIVQLKDDLVNLAKYLGATTVAQGNITSFKQLMDLLFTTAKEGEEVRLKVVYKDKVVSVDFDKGNGLSEEELKAKYSPYVVITRNDLYWFKWKTSNSDFRINPQYDFVEYEVVVKEPPIPSSDDDLPFSLSTNDDDVF